MDGGEEILLRIERFRDEDEGVDLSGSGGEDAKQPAPSEDEGEGKSLWTRFRSTFVSDETIESLQAISNLLSKV